MFTSNQVISTTSAVERCAMARSCRRCCSLTWLVRSWSKQVFNCQLGYGQSGGADSRNSVSAQLEQKRIAMTCVTPSTSLKDVRPLFVPTAI